jgi:hypothetical protein
LFPTDTIHLAHVRAASHTFAPPLERNRGLSVLELGSQCLVCASEVELFVSLGMERWGAKGMAAPEPGRTGRRLYADQPSFSSTLLDAIYKSMDEADDGAAEAMTGEAKRREDYGHHCYNYMASLAGSYRASSRAPHAATSSSSDCSSYGGFSSSEAESSQHRHRLRPIRTTAASSGVSGGAARREKPGATIRAKLRDLRKPASPGARLAGFLNSIFAGKHRRGGGPATPPSSSRAAAESACSTASSSSYSRSCLSKTPSTRGQPNRRTVRFLDSDVEAPAVSRGAVQLLRRMETESDEDDEDSSDASSDLFELENLAAVAPAAGNAAYRDELPVYETTRVAQLNRAIVGHGHGYAAHGRSTRLV